MRFLYFHPLDWYLSISTKKRDVIEKSVSNLDLSGWDLRKALHLFYKSNPPLMEWLQSPIVYKDTLGIAEHLRIVMSGYYSPKAAIYHYYHMAKNNYRVYLKGSQVWLKKYLYVLRPLLAVRWIEGNLGQSVPVKFDDLLSSLSLDAPVLESINELVRTKRLGYELKWGPVIPELNTYIKSEFDRLEEEGFDNIPSVKPPIHLLDGLFSDIVKGNF